MMNGRWGGYDILRTVLQCGQDVIEAAQPNLSIPFVFGEDDDQTKTPLVLAAEDNDMLTMRLLLERQVHIESRRETDGKTALLIAAQRDNLSMMRLLLEHQANTESIGVDGRTALMVAIRNQNTSAATLLMDHGALVLVGHGHRSQTVFSLAVQADSLEMVRGLVESYHARGLMTSEVKSALIRAAISKIDIGILRLLLEYGCTELEVSDDWGRTLLHSAAEEGDPEIVRILLDHHCKIDATDSRGQTALIIAVRRNNVGVAQLLLQRGCSTSAIDYKGKTALMIATARKYADMIALLS